MQYLTIHFLSFRCQLNDYFACIRICREVLYPALFDCFADLLLTLGNDFA